MRFNWSTPGVEDRLRFLWINERKSGSEVAAVLSRELSADINRVMVLGVVRRLGIGSQGGALDPLQGLKAIAKGEAAHRKASARPSSRHVAGGCQMTAATGSETRSDLTTMSSFAASVEGEKMDTPPDRPGVSLLDLKPRSCRFPVTPFGARVHLFCGDPTTDEKSSWCEAHRAVVFTDRRTEPFVRRRGAVA